MKKFLIFLLTVLILTLAGCKQTVPEEAASLPADAPQAETQEPSVYCGNTQTTLQFCNEFGIPTGEAYTFMGSPSVTLTDLLRKLDYDPDKVCKCCCYSITVTTEFGGPYYVSFDEAYVRYGNGQADLTEEQLRTIQTIAEDLQKEKYQ